MTLFFSLLFALGFQFQEGDLLFQDCDCGAICDAIENVTEGRDGRRFSHIGMVVDVNDTLFVIEANVGGVKLVPLEKFIYRYTDKYGNPTIAVGRLKSIYHTYIPKATDYIKSKLGYEYDDDFLLNNGKYYCSELIYEGFLNATSDSTFFHLYPMTFKDKKTGKFDKEFESYYAKLGMKVPEGEMGINPGSISREDKLNVYYLY